jgi:peptidyl-prolyl cis-trans isomerase C
MNKTFGAVLLLVVGANLGSGRLTAAEGQPADSQAAKPAAKVDQLFADKIIAKGKGFEIKQSQLDDAMAGLKSTFLARGQTLTPADIAQAQPHVLQRLIQIQVLLTKATDADKAEGKKATDKRLEEMVTRMGGEESLNRQLKSVGTTQEEIKRKMFEESTAEFTLEREMKVTVSDEEVKKFYDDNPAKFEQPEMVRASHILLSTRNAETNTDLSDAQKATKKKTAEDLLKRARAGEDFAKLAKEYSEDPGSKDKGGEYQFPRGQMVPEFEAAAFSLKTNEVSEIVTTQFGYHIIKLSEKIPAKKLAFDKVAPDIREFLRQQQMQKRQEDIRTLLAKFEKDDGVEILDEKLKVKDPPEDAAAAPAKKEDAK